MASNLFKDQKPADDSLMSSVDVSNSQTVTKSSGFSLLLLMMNKKKIHAGVILHIYEKMTQMSLGKDCDGD